MKAWKITGLAVALVMMAFLLIAAILQSWPFYGHGDVYLSIQRTDRREEPLVTLNETEVQTELPFFARALRQAREDGGASVTSRSQIDRIWDYVDAHSDVKRRTVFVEFEDQYFLLMMRGGE